MSAATGDAGFFDSGLTDGAGLAFLTEDLSEFFEIISLAAVGLAVVFHGRAAGIDRELHDGLEVLEE